MQKTIKIIILTSLIFSLELFGDVNVKGYYRSNGTYVKGYTRSSPDSTRSNNYGSSAKSGYYDSPRSRDYDNDGIPNYLDNDDDNDGVSDDKDSNQYGW
ncbi:MAG: hypothetical protein DRG78_01465 [Epsilonproteobacteria bacterium]|nr:MAG: hypothetical protein DRG78_01465 [Campylobacterota bacterium]